MKTKSTLMKNICLLQKQKTQRFSFPAQISQAKGHHSASKPKRLNRDHDIFLRIPRFYKESLKKKLSRMKLMYSFAFYASNGNAESFSVLGENTDFQQKNILLKKYIKRSQRGEKLQKYCIYF